jgi:hypothetical protein
MNKSEKQAFVKAIMADVPQADYEAQYEKDAQQHPRPWELWLTTHKFRRGWWHCNESDMDFHRCDYRRHKHADLMIEAHQNPAAEWELQTQSGLWIPANPEWKDEYKYRRVPEVTATAKTPHPHAQSMKLYAEDAAETDKPWERWEFRYPTRTQEWSALNSDIYWVRSFEYRRKPQTITVNGREVPAPYYGPLKENVAYYGASPASKAYFICLYTSGNYAPNEVQERGILHLTKEAAAAHAKAMLGVDA